jgi:hypothetical protein
VLPGTVVIVVRAEGWKDARKEVEVAAGELETVVMPMTRVVEKPVPEEPPTPIDDEPGLGTIRGVGIGVAALGVAGLVVAAVTGAMVQGNVDELDDACGGARCVDESYADLIDETKTLKLVTNIGAFGGGGLVLAGVLMIIFGGPGEAEESAAHPYVVPMPGGIVGGYALRF